MNSTAISPASRNHFATCVRPACRPAIPGCTARRTRQLDAVQRHAERAQFLPGHLGAFRLVRDLQVRIPAHALSARSSRSEPHDLLMFARGSSHALDPIHNVAATIGTHADQEGDQALRGRPEAAGGVAARIDGLLVVLDEGDDRRLLVRGQLAVTELRHVLRAAEHRAIDLPVRRRVEVRRVLALGERAALAGEVVAGRAVQPEELAAPGDLGVVAQVAVRNDRAAAVGLDVRGQCVGLRRR